MPSKTPEKNREYQRTWFAKHKELQKSRNKANRKKKTQWLSEYKASLKCVKCGESHVACLDFHHRDPTAKEDGIGLLIRKAWSMERILQEIEKCDVLCSNCHRKLHWEECTGQFAYRAVADGQHAAL